MYLLNGINPIDIDGCEVHKVLKNIILVEKSTNLNSKRQRKYQERG